MIKTEKTQITDNIRCEPEDISKDLVAIKGIMREYYKQIYIQKFNNLNRPVPQCLQTTENQDEISNWNNRIVIKLNL